jgi:hypothetical protein
MANIVANTTFGAEQAERDAQEAERAARIASFAAARARLLAGTYRVGADQYSSDFWALANRPAPELEGETEHGHNSLHRLPNGDWMSVTNGSWTRHTYDLAYALDRAKRAAIGGYAVRADLVAAIVALCAVGANRMSIGAMFQDVALTRPYIAAHSGAGNLYADEERTSLTHYLTEECAVIHPQHADLIRRVVALLAEPDVIREYPAPIDPALSNVIRDIEATLSGEVAS